MNRRDIVTSLIDLLKLYFATTFFFLFAKNTYEILINVNAELKLIDVASINVKSSCRAIVRKVFVTLPRVNTRTESIVDTEIPAHLRSNLFLATRILSYAKSNRRILGGNRLMSNLGSTIPAAYNPSFYLSASKIVTWRTTSVVDRLNSFEDINCSKSLSSKHLFERIDFSERD